MRHGALSVASDVQALLSCWITRIHLAGLSPTRGSVTDPRFRCATSARRAFPVKLIGDEGKRCAAYRLLFARRFPKRALSSRRRAVRERVTNRLAPIATLALPSHKG